MPRPSVQGRIYRVLRIKVRFPNVCESNKKQLKLGHYPLSIAPISSK